MLDSIGTSLVEVLQPTSLALMLLGIAIGFAVGILPGLGGAVALALMLPFTFGMEPVQVFAFLLGMLVVTSTTGDITSVLFGVPGEPTSAATVFDGNPMARRGEAGRALGAVLISSSMGALIGAVAIVALIPVARPIILHSGPPEFFMLALVGLTFVVTLSARQVAKGLMMAAFGLLISFVGVDPQTAVPRFTFDRLELFDGIGVVPLVVGLFGGAELLQLMLTGQSIAQRKDNLDLASSGVVQGMRECFVHWAVVVRSSVIGVAVSLIPGLGGSVSQFIAYGYARHTSKHPEEFGKGSIEGVIAAGANNNAKDAGSLVPTVAFGIPGNTSMAILLGAFLIAGLQPGPDMLTAHLDITLSMVWIVVIANLIAVACALPLLRPLVRLTYISSAWLLPFLLFFLMVGSYSENSSWADVLIMLAAAALGVWCLRTGWPRVPFLLAFVLGDPIERNFFLANSLHGYDWLLSPGVVAMAALIAVLLFGSPLRGVISRRLAKNIGLEQSEDQREPV